MSASQNSTTTSQVFSALQRPSVPEAAYEAFFKIVGRLEAVLAEETASLKGSGGADFDELTRRKRQGFVDLSRLAQAFEGTIPSQDIINRLASFRRKLDENGTALHLHLQAAQEVTATIVRVMQDFDSDGTYTRSLSRHGSALA